jgi:hypothetical protein
MSDYDKGGVMPRPQLAHYRLDPDECVVTGHPMHCVRADHPTERSGCAGGGRYEDGIWLNLDGSPRL